MFAGPTLTRALAIKPDLPLDDIVIVPPVKRGDVPRVVQGATRPGVIALVDGYFHFANLAVGHLELRFALAQGWQVWGLSSMGAIRAAEMSSMGVRGFGDVFACFRDDPDFRDDEVALLHEPVEPYREVSEPLVHFRAALADLCSRGWLDETDRRAVVDHLMGLWFGERTIELFRQLVLARRPSLATETDWWESFDRFRVKAHDLLRFLDQQPWTSPP
jgi:hypothetical protein